MGTTVISRRDAPTNWHLDSNYVDIGRTSRWGNPWTHKQGRTRAKYVVATRLEAITAYRRWILSDDEEAQYLRSHLDSLKGKVLVCWCKPLACHGDVLAELADSWSPEVSV